MSDKVLERLRFVADRLTAKADNIFASDVTEDFDRAKVYRTLGALFREALQEPPEPEKAHTEECRSYRAVRWEKVCICGASSPPAKTGEDVVDRLNNADGFRDGAILTNKLLREAADEIASLRDRLKPVEDAEIKSALYNIQERINIYSGRPDHGVTVTLLPVLRNLIERLARERDELKKALEEISTETKWSNADQEWIPTKSARRARAALSPETSNG